MKGKLLDIALVLIMAAMLALTAGCANLQQIPQKADQATEALKEANTQTMTIYKNAICERSGIDFMKQLTSMEVKALFDFCGLKGFAGSENPFNKAY